MTAYGCSSKTTPLGRLVVEIQTLNRKMLDIQLSLPKELFSFELEIRKWVAHKVERGQLHVRIHLEPDEALLLQLPLLKQLKKSWEKIAADLGYNPEDVITLSFLMNQLPYQATSEHMTSNDKMSNALKECMESALGELMEMKKREGETLATDVDARLKIIEEHLKKIDERSSFAVDKYREKLKDRLSEFQLGGKEAEERILREIVLYAERLDVTEEKIRLNSHIDQFRHLLKTPEKSIGRTLEFLTQELNREINTLASKSADSELSFLTVAIKSEIEKIREQIQNIE